MTTLAADRSRDYELGNTLEIPMVASDIIFESAAVGDDGSGYARPLVAGDPFLGFAESRVDNSSGGAGARRVRLRAEGAVLLSVAGATGVANLGATVYASDDDTFTLTEGSNSPIGRVIRHDGGSQCVVRFQAAAYRSL